MDRWKDLVDAEPELAERVAARFASAKHHVLATLRRDGSPRVSGTEIQFFDGDLTIGMMPGSVKALDLGRDGRCALHAHPGDGSMDGGDAKVSGVAFEVTDADERAAYLQHLADAAADGDEAPGSDDGGEAPGSDDGGDGEGGGFEFALFRLSLRDVVLTSIHPDGDRLQIETWHPGQPVKVVERA
ncbi:MAG: pyridoxamine 5'-phosphate oxidase family protein [Actinomycetota bacterium]